MTQVTSRKLAALIVLKDHLRDIVEQTNARAIAQEDSLMRSLSDTLMALAELADVMEREAELHQQVYKAMLEPEFELRGITKGRVTATETGRVSGTEENKANRPQALGAWQGTQTGRYIGEGQGNIKELRPVPASWVGDAVKDHEETIYRAAMVNGLATAIVASPGTLVEATDKIEARLPESEA